LLLSPIYNDVAIFDNFILCIFPWDIRIEFINKFIDDYFGFIVIAK
jgi:hypothetical protein